MKEFIFGAKEGLVPSHLFQRNAIRAKILAGLWPVGVLIHGLTLMTSQIRQKLKAVLTLRAPEGVGLCVLLGMVGQETQIPEPRSTDPALMGPVIIRLFATVAFNEVMGEGQNVGLKLLQGHEGVLTLTALESIFLEMFLQMLGEAECLFIASTTVETLVRFLSPRSALCGFLSRIHLTFLFTVVRNQLPSTSVLASGGLMLTLPLQAGMYVQVFGHALDGWEGHIAPSTQNEVLTAGVACRITSCLGHLRSAVLYTRSIRNIAPAVNNLTPRMITLDILKLCCALLAGNTVWRKSFMGGVFQLHEEAVTFIFTSATFIFTFLGDSWCV